MATKKSEHLPIHTRGTCSRLGMWIVLGTFPENFPTFYQITFVNVRKVSVVGGGVSVETIQSLLNKKNCQPRKQHSMNTMSTPTQIRSELKVPDAPRPPQRHVSYKPKNGVSMDISKRFDEAMTSANDSVEAVANPVASYAEAAAKPANR